mgnify:CR=1 FL=1
MISLECPCCATPLFSASPYQGQDVKQFLSAWKAQVAGGRLVCGCLDCSSEFRLVDDGTPVNSGGSVTLEDISRPMVTGLSKSTGSMLGGETLTITGSSLDVDTLTVKFDGATSLSVTQVTPNSAVVTVPTGRLRLNLDVLLMRISADMVNGAFEAGESVTTTNGSTGIIKLLRSGDYLVEIGRASCRERG